MRITSCALRIVVFILMLAVLVSPISALSSPWKFAVMADTQWKVNNDGKCPNGVAVGIINAINAECIKQGAKFVIQVGDLTGPGDSAAMKTRAAAAEALYKAGIGFYPLRGNHEGNQSGAVMFQELYPQTQHKGPHIFGASNFTSPFVTLNGLSYSFDYNNARFILLDQYTRTDNSNNLKSLQDTINDVDGLEDDNILDQLDWIDTRLSTRPKNTHAFVFAHKTLIDQHHTDALFGKDPTANYGPQNKFIKSLAVNGVHYFLGGHDHLHHRSFVKSPDGRYEIQEIICASNSYKFYIPRKPACDIEFNGAGGCRETPIVQELGTIGFYIFTVAGPRVMVEYYASDNGQSNNGLDGIAADGEVNMVDLPKLSFTKRETFGYNFSGKEFKVPQDESYTLVKDKFQTTSMRILGGVNGSKMTDFSTRPLVKAVNTGWIPKTSLNRKHSRIVYSDILSLWGMADIGSEKTDTYTLSMSYKLESLNQLADKGNIGLAIRDKDGNWINAVNKNSGGTKKFVAGPWISKYQLGTYGIDLSINTAWAVLNYNGDFAIAVFK